MKKFLFGISTIVAITICGCTQEDDFDNYLEEYPTMSSSFKTRAPEPGGQIPHMAIDGYNKLVQLHHSDYSCFTFSIRLEWKSTSTDGCTQDDITDCSLAGCHSTNNDFAASNITCHASWNDSGTGFEVTIGYVPRQRTYDIFAHEYIWIIRDSVNFTSNVSIGEYIHDY